MGWEVLLIHCRNTPCTAECTAIPPAFIMQGNASSWIKTTIMMEEYLDGPEVDVDLVFSEGQPVRGGFGG